MHQFSISKISSVTHRSIYLVRCGHCKKLAPEYEKLGASFKKAKSVFIAKVYSQVQYLLIIWALLENIFSSPSCYSEVVRKWLEHAYSWNVLPSSFWFGLIKLRILTSTLFLALGWLRWAQECVQQVWSFWVPNNSMVPQRIPGAQKVRLHNFCSNTFEHLHQTKFSWFISLQPCRYEGQRSAEALAEFVNTEGGNTSNL